MTEQQIQQFLERPLTDYERWVTSPEYAAYAQREAQRHAQRWRALRAPRPVFGGPPAWAQRSNEALDSWYYYDWGRGRYYRELQDAADRLKRLDWTIRHNPGSLRW